jgi:hypothetical protein
MSRTLLSLLSAVVVAAVVGVAAGTIAARSVAARSTTAGSVATEAPSELVIGPSAPPAIPEGFPSASQAYVPTTVTELRDAWLEKEPEWNCEKTASSVGTSTTCRPPDSELDPTEQYAIDLAILNHDVDPTVVTGVEASCELDRPGSRRCRSFFSDVAATVLGSDPALSEEAGRWARANTAVNNTTVIGGIRLTAELDPQTITFESEAAGG